MYAGPKGMDGPQGMKGETGDAGPPGPDGRRGMKGANGEPGQSGMKGEPGQAGAAFNLLTLHSQTNSTPSCPAGTTQLWTGYSLGYTDGDGFGHGQDLGKSGSCVRRFNTIPFMMCRGRKENGRCHYSFRSEKTYWLSTAADEIDEQIPMDENEDYISRCSVCEINAAVLAVHSQSNTIPDCPASWISLWVGYSFLMVSSCVYSSGVYAKTLLNICGGTYAILYPYIPQLTIMVGSPSCYELLNTQIFK